VNVLQAPFHLSKTETKEVKRGKVEGITKREEQEERRMK